MIWPPVSLSCKILLLNFEAQWNPGLPERLDCQSCPATSGRVTAQSERAASAASRYAKLRRKFYADNSGSEVRSALNAKLGPSMQIQNGATVAPRVVPTRPASGWPGICASRSAYRMVAGGTERRTCTSVSGSRSLSRWARRFMSADFNCVLDRPAVPRSTEQHRQGFWRMPTTPLERNFGDFAALSGPGGLWPILTRQIGEKVEHSSANSSAPSLLGSRLRRVGRRRLLSGSSARTEWQLARPWLRHELAQAAEGRARERAAVPRVPVGGHDYCLSGGRTCRRCESHATRARPSVHAGPRRLTQHAA
jgi:hypothetical protein